MANVFSKNSVNNHTKYNLEKEIYLNPIVAVVINEQLAKKIGSFTITISQNNHSKVSSLN